MAKIIRPLRSGQITIPADFREELHIDADTLLQISLIQGELRIKPVKAVDTVGGSAWMKDLYKVFAPVRKEAKDKSYTKERIDIAIDRAVKGVRTKHDEGRL